jgi:hypothetical protein
VGTSDPSAPFSKLRDQRSRKRCQDKLHSALYLWPSIRPHNIKLHGIRLHGIRILSISNISSNLFLPIRMANPRKTNQGTTWINRRSLRMINSIGSCLYGCRVWYGGWITRWKLVHNHHQEGRHGSERMRTFTPWGGVDSPRWWGYTCLGFVS